MATERITITLPVELVQNIDRLEKNRSRFLQEAARRELDRRRRELLERSLQNPHPDSAEMTGLGFQDWVSSLPEEDVVGLVNPQAGREIRWVPEQGWTEIKN